MPEANPAPNPPARVALLATCIVDQLFPDVGLATLRLLARFGVKAEFPKAQTCCGQPFFNMGHHAEARKLARHTLEVFEGYDAVVLPSGSCTSMIRIFYGDVFDADDPLRPRVMALGEKTFELSEFLVKTLGVTDVQSNFSGSVTYHDGCHCLRELRVREEPRTLIRSVKGCQLVDLEGSDSCCGFGGTFSVKFDDISAAMVKDKVAAVEKAGAQYVVSTDSSCLMQIGGALSRAGSKVRPLHLAQVLAGDP